MTGESYVTHLTVVEETMGAKQPELKQTDSQSTTQSKDQSVSCCIYICVFVIKKQNKDGGFYQIFSSYQDGNPCKKAF